MCQFLICFLFTSFYLLAFSPLHGAAILFCEKNIRKEKEIISQQAFEVPMVDKIYHLDSSKIDQDGGGHFTKILKGKKIDRFHFIAAAMAADAKLAGLNSLAIIDMEKKLKVRATGVELLELEDTESGLRVDVLCQFIDQSQLNPPPLTPIPTPIPTTDTNKLSHTP